MIKRYFPILILSAICLAACSKQEGVNAEEESSSPIMAIVNETPVPDASTSVADLRDPMQNIVVNVDNDINTAAGANDMAQSQNLAGDIPPGYVQGQSAAPYTTENFADPAQRMLKGQPQAGTNQAIRAAAD